MFLVKFIKWSLLIYLIQKQILKQQMFIFILTTLTAIAYFQIYIDDAKF